MTAPPGGIGRANALAGGGGALGGPEFATLRPGGSGGSIGATAAGANTAGAVRGRARAGSRGPRAGGGGTLIGSGAAAGAGAGAGGAAAAGAAAAGRKRAGSSGRVPHGRCTEPAWTVTTVEYASPPALTVTVVRPALNGQN